MTKRTYKVGDRVYVPGLAGHVELKIANGDDTFECVRFREDDLGIEHMTVHTVHVTAMEPEKSDLYREPDTSGW